jgi:hypothetical protein
VRRTHVLSSAGRGRGTGQDRKRKPASKENSRPIERRERETGQESERKPASEEDSPSVERRVRDCSGERNKASQRGALTSCRAQSKGLVRIVRERQPERSTHRLSSAERWTGQGSERKAASEAHSRTVERRARGSSEQRKKGSQ